MSYDIELICPCCNSIIEDTHVKETYNRHQIYKDYLDSKLGIRWLYGKNYTQIKTKCEAFIKAVGTVPQNDFYDATDKGRAGLVIQKILTNCKENPHAKIKGD